jgi:hypothetical protein
MRCYECAKSGKAEDAVALCTLCSAGLCMTHLRQAAGYRVGGPAPKCPHDTWSLSASKAAAGGARV